MSYHTTYGLFDPNILGVFIDQRPPSSIAKYFEGSIKDYLPEVQKKLPKMSESDRIDMMFFSSVISHELKHFHDTVGTTFGFHYFRRKFSREATLWSIIKKVAKNGFLRIPLEKWTLTSSCPHELRNFFNLDESNYVEQEAFFSAKSYPGEKKQIPDLIINSKLPWIQSEHNFSIPVANFGFEVCKRNKIRHHYYPINVLTLLEGSAFNIQMIQVHDLFGKEAGQSFSNLFRYKMFTSDLWVYFLTSLLISNASQKFNVIPSEKLQYRIHDFAFMGDIERYGLTHNVLPGSRFSLLIHHLIYEQPKRTLIEDDIITILEEFDSQMSDGLSKNDLFMKELTQIDSILTLFGSDGSSLIFTLLESVPQIAVLQLAKIYKSMINLRLEKPSVFTDPWAYMSSETDMPLPPAMMILSNENTTIIGDIFKPIEAKTAEDISNLPSDKFWSLYRVMAQRVSGRSLIN